VTVTTSAWGQTQWLTHSQRPCHSSVSPLRSHSSGPAA
jgi:hypothetical protein